MKPLHILTLYCLSIVGMLPILAAAPGEPSRPARTFILTYQLTIKDLPAGARHVRVWIPRAVTDANQTVTAKNITAPVHLREVREALYGNHLLYGEIAHPPSGPLQISVEYQVTRHEYSKGNYASVIKAAQAPASTPKNLARFLEPDRLVPIDGRIKEMADETTRGKRDTVEKARAIYEYVFKTVRYDKSGTGWGRGDSLWVCDAKHGNCTDFHSLFISMARAEGIPARFEIGFPLSTASEGTIPGYHCWAEFYAEGIGWVPVDISEAWKDPKKHDYFFGALDPNRVQFSVGRDLTLQPKQAGAPLNYFIYPYVEVDGKPFEGMDKKFTYRDVAGSPTVAEQFPVR